MLIELTLFDDSGDVVLRPEDIITVRDRGSGGAVVVTSERCCEHARVKESASEVREKWEKALAESRTSTKIMLGEDGQVTGWLDREGEFHEAKAKQSGSGVIDLTPEEEPL